MCSRPTFWLRPGGRPADIFTLDDSWLAASARWDRHGSRSANAESRLFKRTQSGGLIPGTSALLRGRSDFGEMIAFQDGFYEEHEHQQEDGLDEERPSKHEAKKIFGMDQRPFFPAVLMFSIMWSMALTSTQVQVVEDLFGTSWHCNTLFFSVYLVTCLTMAYTSLSNPGYMDDSSFSDYLADPQTLPRRAFKHWLYKKPILRFHQYCRWVTNCIGLYNHRSYIVMLVGFVTMASFDTALDLVHVLMWIFQFELSVSETVRFFMLFLHLIYSTYLAYYTKPLVQMHIGFVARNELTQEWKRDDFQIVYNNMTGEPVAVTDLDEEEYEEYFDHFVYDPSRNPWDKGWVENCRTFWCTPRWEIGQKGEF